MAATVCLATIYYFVFVESMYVSATIVTVQTKSSMAFGASSILSGVLEPQLARARSSNFINISFRQTC